MWQHEEPKSLQVLVVRGFARNYRSFLRLKSGVRTDEQSNLRKIYSEELEAARRHPHMVDNVGFS